MLSVESKFSGLLRYWLSQSSQVYYVISGLLCYRLSQSSQVYYIIG